MGNEKRRRAPLLDKLEPGVLQGGSGSKPRSGPSPDRLYNDANHAVGELWRAGLSFMDIGPKNGKKAKSAPSFGKKSKKKKSFLSGIF
jgi:hypothetical protein